MILETIKVPKEFKEWVDNLELGADRIIAAVERISDRTFPEPLLDFYFNTPITFMEAVMYMDWEVEEEVEWLEGATFKASDRLIKVLDVSYLPYYGFTSYQCFVRYTEGDTPHSTVENFTDVDDISDVEELPKVSKASFEDEQFMDAALSYYNHKRDLYDARGGDLLVWNDGVVETFTDTFSIPTGALESNMLRIYMTKEELNEAHGELRMGWY